MVLVLLPFISANAHLTVGSEKEDEAKGPRWAAVGAADKSVGVSADDATWVTVR
jgi:hypothetical protein